MLTDPVPSLCLLQVRHADGAWLATYANVDAGAISVTLTTHDTGCGACNLSADEQEDDEKDDAADDAAAEIVLSAEGWATLVELYALRQPEAFSRIVGKWQALREGRACQP